MEPTWNSVLAVFLSFPCWGLAWEPDGSFLWAAGPLPGRVLRDPSGARGSPGARPAAAAAGESACRQPLPALLPGYFRGVRGARVTHYKVFLSWAQLLPAGSSQEPDEDAVRCYRRLLGAVRAAGLRPLGVLHRAGLPAPARARASEAFAGRFADYAAFAFRAFGDLVETWFTFSDLEAAIRELPHQKSRSSRLQTLADAHRRAYEIFHEKYASPGEFAWPWRPTRGGRARPFPASSPRGSASPRSSAAAPSGVSVARN